MPSHLPQTIRAQTVSGNPCVKQRVAGEWRFGFRPFEELTEGRAHIALAAAEHGTNQHSAGGDEEFLPQLARLFETCWPKRFDLKSSNLQSFCGSVHGRANLWGNRRTAIVLEITDAQLPSLAVARPAKRNRRGAGVTVVRTLHHFEQSSYIGNGPRHGADYADQRKRAARRGKVARRRNATRRRLKPADPAEMGGYSD